MIASSSLFSLILNPLAEARREVPNLGRDEQSISRWEESPEIFPACHMEAQHILKPPNISFLDVVHFMVRKMKMQYGMSIGNNAQTRKSNFGQDVAICLWACHDQHTGCSKKPTKISFGQLFDTSLPPSRSCICFQMQNFMEPKLPAFLALLAALVFGKTLAGRQVVSATTKFSRDAATTTHNLLRPFVPPRYLPTYPTHVIHRHQNCSLQRGGSNVVVRGYLSGCI
jgi:hypothetical protein